MGPRWRALIQALPLLSLLQPIAGISPEEEVRANPAPFGSTDQPSCPPGVLTRAKGDSGLENPPSLVSWDKNTLEKTSEAPLSVVTGRIWAASDPGDRAVRDTQEPSVSTSGSWGCHGSYPCPQWMCVAGNTSHASCHLFQCTCPIVSPCSMTAETLCCIPEWPRSAEDVALHLLPGTDIVSATAVESTQTSARIARSPTLPRSSLGHSGSASWSRPKGLCPLAQCPPVAVSVQVPADAVEPAVHCFPEADAQAPPSLGVQVQVASLKALCLLLDFGDGSEVRVRIHDAAEGAAVIAYHQFGKEGVYMLKAVILSEFHGAEKELGPYYVEIGHTTVSVSMNSSSLHKDGLVVLMGSHTDQKGTVITHRFPAGPSWNVSFMSQTRAGSSQTWAPVTVQYQMQPVSVYTNGTVFATDTDITFLAVTKETTSLVFLWFFGEGPPMRTTSRLVKKRLRIPKWYSVTVQASSGLGRVASEPRHIRTQRRIVANRLVSPSSALLNTSVTFECRLTFGSDVAFLWDFGDGAVSPGGSSSTHRFGREGEFTVQVLAFNDVSAASLRKQLFVVRERCQPPPVMRMGPQKLQVWRSQPVKLGVTFESAILCDISQGLSYTWTFWNSEGAQVLLPPAVSTHGQTLTVPGYFLQPGNYTALAKVQVEGSVVHSTYCVGVEVRVRAPVSVISEGTHLFISRAPSFTVILRGSQSYDPDSPGAVLRYHWECTAASTPGRSCFAVSSPQSLDARAPTFSFPAGSLSDSYDQFLVTLMVSSGGRNSSEAQVFLSTRPDSELRFVHISWVNFRDIFVNWNEELCLQAECEGCGKVSGLSYSWDLFLVNATEGTSMEAPFCRTVGLLGSAGLGAASRPPESSPPSTEPSWPEPHAAGVPSSREPSPQTWGQPGLSVTGKPSFGPMVGWHRVPTMGDAAAPGVTPQDRGSPGPSPGGGSSPAQGPSPSPSDFEAYYSNIQEAGPSRGRQPADWTDTSLPGSGPSPSADGDNLLGPLPPAAAARLPLMVDWHKSLVSRTLFHGSTASGITGRTVTIKPFSLSPGKTYVLQATVASKPGLLGRAQLYVMLRPAPRDVACQVQPHRGLEAHTIFSIFCVSGRPDFHYEFSYQVGNGSRHTLYRGTDSQYYFALPAGEPSDGYNVVLSIKITDGMGSQVQPCSVAVTVLPRLHRGLCPDEDIYNSSLKQLSTLRLMRSHTEARNYIAMITRVLSRWATDDSRPPCGQWSRIQDALISSACGLPSVDQEDMLDSVLMFRDLLRLPHKVSFTSAALLLKSARALLAQSPLSGRPAVAEGTLLELLLLVSAVWDVSDQETPRSAGFLQEEGIKVISALLLDGLSATRECELHVSAGQMEFHTLLHRDRQGATRSLGSVRVHLPGDLAETRSPCCISQLMFFRKNPFPGGRTPGQMGPLLALSLFTCSSRRPISRRRLTEPLAVEFGEEDGLDERRDSTTFVLLRERVNFHQFSGCSETSRESLQIRIEFSRPVSRAFPVMVLIRFSEKPTPSDFLVKKVYVWDEPMVHVFVPASSLRDAGSGYLSLLDADHDRSPRNQHLAKAVNYTVRFQGLQCLFWETGAWRSADAPPKPGASPDKVRCSYDRLAPVSIARRTLSTSFSVEDISMLQRRPENLLPGILIAVSTVLYALLVTKTRRADHQERASAGYIFLQEDAPADAPLYAVVVDTGFRAPARCSAKVYIVLCGENGVSEPRELYCPERPLFKRNSRHTFVLSTSARLGPLRRIRLWHDSCGPCPAWYVSHVMVQELGAGPTPSWLFPAECWLAANHADGRVQRELACLCRGPGFWKLLYSKFTEYLEDFHIWTSVYSRPSPRGLLHTPRLTVAFALLCTYSCLTALATASGQEQLLWALGAPDPAPGSFQTGLLCTLLASPAAQLLSLLLRLAQEPSRLSPVKALLPPRRAPLGTTQGPDLHGRTPEAQKGHKHNIVSGLARAHGRATGGDDAGGPAPELEACRAAPGQRATGKEGDCGTLGARVPTSGPGRPAALQQPRALPPWSSSIAWAICWLVSMACGFGTAFLGYRFNPTQCAQWLQVLTLSVLCCVFVTQPLLVGLLALGFAWRRRDDPHFFTESLQEATRDLGSELEEHARTRKPWCARSMEEMVAARQRARRLGWARPPCAAQLHVTRERMRRDSQTWGALRDTCVYTLLLLLHWIILCGKGSWDEHALNQAVRSEFTRNVRSSSGGLMSVEAWWGWSLTTLLDGLYGHGAPTVGPPGTQPGALGGTCQLMGTLLIKQLRDLSDECELPSPPWALTEHSPPTRGPQGGAANNRSVTEPAIPGMAQRGPRNCTVREHWVLSLGSTRPAAHAALRRLRASRWVDRSTRTVSVHFALYNPPTRLLSSVSLHTKLLPAGGLALSPWVESIAVFRGDVAQWYRRTLPELAFLVLNLTGLCLHVWGMAATGVRSYWCRPGRWLELAVVAAGLAYSAASSQLVTLTEEVAAHFQKGLFQGFLDLSQVASWNQRATWLQGTLSFVLTLKCICLVGIQTPAASCSFLTCHSLAGVFTAGLAGVLLLAMAAGSLLCVAPHGAFTVVFQGLPFCFPGRCRDTFAGLSESGLRAPAWCCVTFFMVLSTAWLGTLRGSLTSFPQKRKSFPSKPLVRLEDMAACVWGRCLAWLGLAQPQQTEAEPAEGQRCYLDEAADLLDELLLKVNRLSHSLRHPLPEQHCGDAAEARAEGSPLLGVSA